MNYKKLLNSKWTAYSPRNKEKHFIVSNVEKDPESGEITKTTIEAVMSKKNYDIDWQELNDKTKWRTGWK